MSASRAQPGSLRGGGCIVGMGEKDGVGWVRENEGRARGGREQSTCAQPRTVVVRLQRGHRLQHRQHGIQAPRLRVRVGRRLQKQEGCAMGGSGVVRGRVGGREGGAANVRERDRLHNYSCQVSASPSLCEQWETGVLHPHPGTAPRTRARGPTRTQRLAGTPPARRRGTGRWRSPARPPSRKQTQTRAKAWRRRWRRPAG